MELLEGEMRRWGVAWDAVGLAETWLDAESEKKVGLSGYGVVCTSRREKGGGGVAVFVRDGLTYRERPDLGTFTEEVFESVFVEIIRGGGRRNDIIGVVYRPPGVGLEGFNTEMARVLTKLRGANGYIMGDFNIDLTHGPTSDFMEGVTSVGFYPLISLPTRLTDNTATLIDNILTSNLEEGVETGVVMVRISDHLPVFAFVGGRGGDPEEGAY